MFIFVIKQLVKVLVLPPTGPLLVAFAGLAIIGRHPRRGRILATIGVVTIALLSIPAVGDSLLSFLDRPPPFDIARASDAQAIVILSGGTRPYAVEYGGPTIGGMTLQRVRYGARLARITKLPVLVSGGPVHGVTAEALLMRRALEEFGVSTRWTETRAQNTHENAANSAAILKASGITRVVLVGNAFDFPRSRKEFEAQGIAVIAAPIGLPTAGPPEWGDFLPSPGGMQLCYYSLYEILANVWYDLSNARIGAATHPT